MIFLTDIMCMFFSQAVSMEREGEVRKARPPFDPAALALPPSFRSPLFADLLWVDFFQIIG